MIEFREQYARRELGLNVIAHVNEQGVRDGINPFDHGRVYTDVMRTQPLKQALTDYKFDAAIGGGRRDEEKSRAKERIFSFRDRNHRWDPRNQRPELWSLFNTWKHSWRKLEGFPALELDRTGCMAIHPARADPHRSAVSCQASASGSTRRRLDRSRR